MYTYTCIDEEKAEVEQSDWLSMAHTNEAVSETIQVNESLELQASKASKRISQW